MEMEGGRRRRTAKKALTFHNVSIVSSFSQQFQAAQHVKQCLKLQRDAKKNDTLWKANGTTTITCKKTSENHVLVHTRHTTYTTRTTHRLVSSRLVSSRHLSSPTCPLDLLDTRMPTSRHRKTLLPCCLFVSCPVRCWSAVGCMFVVCLL